MEMWRDVPPCEENIHDEAAEKGKGKGGSGKKKAATVKNPGAGKQRKEDFNEDWLRELIPPPSLSSPTISALSIEPVFPSKRDLGVTTLVKSVTISTGRIRGGGDEDVIMDDKKEDKNANADESQNQNGDGIEDRRDNFNIPVWYAKGSMSAVEKSLFPEYLGGEELGEGKYVAVREGILDCWRNASHKYLGVDAVREVVKTEYEEGLKKVWEFLDVYGFINVGKVDRDTKRQPSAGAATAALPMTSLKVNLNELSRAENSKIGLKRKWTEEQVQSLKRFVVEKAKSRETVNWDEAGKELGKDGKECLDVFLDVDTDLLSEMPISSFRGDENGKGADGVNGDAGGGGGGAQVLPSASDGSAENQEGRGQSRGQLMKELAENLDRDVVKAAVSAALAKGASIDDARSAGLIGGVVERADRLAKEEAAMASCLQAEITALEQELETQVKSNVRDLQQIVEAEREEVEAEKKLCYYYQNKTNGGL